jgi:protein SMG5
VVTTSHYCLLTNWFFYLARYQIDLGYSSDHSLSFYQQAIGLDPSNGSPYNQLAALSELLQQPFEAMYYYLRSMSAQKPFQGVEKNIERLLKKNELLLTDLESRQTSITELELPQFNLNLLLCKFLQLQSVFLKSSMNPSKEHTTSASSSSLSTTDINNLCSAIVSLLEDCLTRDFHKFISNHSETAADNGKDSLLLNDSILLKISALTILPAYNLRLQGSKDTLSACAFSFAVLSLLLLSAHKRLIYRTMMLTHHKDLPVDDLHSLVINVMSAGTSMMELLNRGATPTGTAPVGVASITQTRGQDGGSRMKKKEKIKQLDKRRRRRKPNNGSSSEEEEDDVKISLSHSSLSSLDDDIGEDDLDMIDSFSNSSLDDDEQSLGQPLPLLQESTVAAELDQKAPGKIKGKKKFVLAATFSLVKQENSTNDSAVTDTTANEPSIIDPLIADIAKLQMDTELQRTIHLACSSVVSQEYHLQAIKVLIDWIQSYPAVLATYGKSSATNIWSRLADLLNYLPCERDLHKSGFIETHSCAGWTQTQPVSEDKHLRGFPPLLRIHQSLDHSTANADNLQQVVVTCCAHVNI